jgi:hypothetical protein
MLTALSTICRRERAANAFSSVSEKPGSDAAGREAYRPAICIGPETGEGPAAAPGEYCAISAGDRPSIAAASWNR